MQHCRAHLTVPSHFQFLHVLSDLTHLFHHFTKQSIDAYGPGTIESLHTKFTESGYNIRGLLVELTVLAASHQAEDKPLAAQ